MDAKQYEADIQYKGSFITECSFDNNIIDAVTNCELTHQITVSVSEQIPVDDLTKKLHMLGLFLKALIR